MAEYIEREAAERILESVGAPAYAIHALTLAKTTDVVPVVHGWWIEKPFLLGTSNFCSLCGSFYGMPHGKFNYCPNCGARMDGE